METRLGTVNKTPVRKPLKRAYKSELYAGHEERRLAGSVGIKQFGVNHVVLAPGSISALRHWHEGEDEFVLVLEGELMLVDENGEHVLRAGTYAGFPAGVPNAHHLINKSDQTACFLAVGTRKRGREVVHYPDDSVIGTGVVVRDENGERITT